MSFYIVNLGASRLLRISTSGEHDAVYLCCFYLFCKKSRHIFVNVNESCHLWMSRLTYEWVMSHVKESRWHKKHTSISLVCDCFVGSNGTHEGVTWHMNESCRTWSCRATIRQVPRSLLFVSALWEMMAHMKESCPTWMRHVISEGVTLLWDEYAKSVVCACCVGSHGTHEGVVPFINASYCKWRSGATVRDEHIGLSIVSTTLHYYTTLLHHTTTLHYYTTLLHHTTTLHYYTTLLHYTL